MSKLPAGVAAVLANMESGRVILTSDDLSPEQQATATVVARYKALGGESAVLVGFGELDNKKPPGTGGRSYAGGLPKKA